MKIYDISQEVFSCSVYPGDPKPEKQLLSSTAAGDLYNLTAFSMCAHNGTHIDAPYHFLENGARVEQIPLENTVGCAFVAEHHGLLSGADAAKILLRAERENPESAKRILLKGDLTVTEEAAKVFANARILLLGNESQSVGPLDAPMAVHLALLGAGIVLLEGIRLSAAKEGVYFLSASPLNLGGADGAPCRAVLIDTMDADKNLL
jgi:arylformamidase